MITIRKYPARVAYNLGPDAEDHRSHEPISAFSVEPHSHEPWPSEREKSQEDDVGEEIDAVVVEGGVDRTSLYGAVRKERGVDEA